MAKEPFFLEIKGLKELIKRVDDKAANLQKEIDAEIGFAAEEIAGRAKAIVQGTISDSGFLAGGISAARESLMNWKIVSVRRYSPYVEFGTGTLVSVPKDLVDYAIQFKGRGIRQVNLPARPFFFPSFEGAKQPLIDRIEKIINTI